MSTQRPPLFTFRFVALCLLTLLAYCNTSVFYSLYTYLEQLGIAQAWRGPILSASALSTLLCFLFVTPRLTVRNAPRAVYAGIALLILCGLGYLFATGTAGMLSLRLLNGAGIALLSAAAMTLLVAHIPPSRSGQAFGFYSVAMLLRYSFSDMTEEAAAIEAAVQKTLSQGYRTGDIREDGCKLVGCVEMADAVLANL